MRRRRCLPGCGLSFALTACFSPTGSVFTSVSSSSGELTTSGPVSLTDAPTTGTTTAAESSTTAEMSTTGTFTDASTSGPSTGDPVTGSDTSSGSDTGADMCGNATLEGDEQCDDGLLNGDDKFCTTACKFNVCGDEKPCTTCTIPEECDDGNVLAGDGCDPGCLDEVKYAFVTSDRYWANFGGLVGADQLCATHADGKFHPSRTFVAWLSTTAVSAKSRLAPTTFSYRNVDGDVIAATPDDLLDGTLLLPIATDENGDVVDGDATCVAESAVWTGTTELGEPAPEHCGDWVVGNLGAQVGNPMVTDQRWSKDCVLSCFAGPMRLYCIEKG
jgi:cysteine-rich repeat protein